MIRSLTPRKVQFCEPGLVAQIRSELIGVFFVKTVEIAFAGNFDSRCARRSAHLEWGSRRIVCLVSPTHAGVYIARITSAMVTTRIG